MKRFLTPMQISAAIAMLGLVAGFGCLGPVGAELDDDALVAGATFGPGSAGAVTPRVPFYPRLIERVCERLGYHKVVHFKKLIGIKNLS